VAHLVEVFRAVRRVLRPNATPWLVLGDSYANVRRAEDYKPKDLHGLPWQVALALRRDGSYLRRDIIWEKP
jgi:site-specific DNA-methyltransferase (cytosine-N4-specific)